MRRGAPVFVDTAYWVALLNARDQQHAAAVALAARWHRLDTKLLTCDAVVVETYNWFARSPVRRAAATALSTLRGAPGWTIVHASVELISRGQSRYAAHDDKTWSLTDCVSMEVAFDHGVTQVATTDAHFEQAGFEILLGRL